ncbi:MAG: hypothetical protein PHS30_09145 [Bacteroidales bacterium]|nr:hypothetical protein [Bacteroidales bacterium]
MKDITIGLFGTCGSSKWREPFMKRYDELGISYFNPQKNDWKAEDAKIEAEHLANDQIILFPVTNETYAFGSLGEVGFSIMQALKLDQNRDIIIMIEPDVYLDVDSMPSELRATAEAQRKESVRMRALIMAHLKKVNYQCVWLVKDLDNMLNLSLELHAIQTLKNGAKRFII